MNVLLLAPELEASDRWLHTISEAAPGTIIVKDREVPDDEISVAIVDGPPPGRLSEIPNLKLILSLSAGIDAMMLDPTFPEVPIVRLVPPEMIALMREYVCYQVLRLHRGFAAIEQLHRELRWEWLSAAKPAMERRVLVLGLGDLGRGTAEALANLGFQVSGWSRRQKWVSGVQCEFGMPSLKSLLSSTEILVNLLPLTPLTNNLLGSELFECLPRGAALINVGRGACLNEIDLIAALDSGQISHATLDVFSTEPLPVDHPFWNHPKITITPHTAAYPPPESFLHSIIDNLNRIYRGEMPPNAMLRRDGY